MWISKIELFCFKSYQHQLFEFPKPAGGRNIVLVGGMNGYGKTTILEALYLCLFGKDALVYLARAGLKTDDNKGYPTFLENAFNGEARREGRDTMCAKVTISLNQTRAIEVSRKWFFRANGSWAAEEEAVVREITRDVPALPRVDGKNGFFLSDLLDDMFVPAHIAPFFFFDGEEVKKLADQSRVEQVKQGLEGLLGVVLLRMLADRLKQFESGRRGEITNVDERKVAELFDSLTNNERQLETLKSRLGQIEEKQSKLKAQRQALLERITAAGGGGGDIATVKDLVEEREQFRNRLKECRKKLEDVLAGRLPFHLVSKELVNHFRKQLAAEMRFFSWQADKRSLEPRKAEFEEAFTTTEEPAIIPELTVDQMDAVKKRIEIAWASLFYPPPDDCAKDIEHSYLHESLREKTMQLLDSLGLGTQEIQGLLNEQTLVQQRIDELGRKISRLEGIDRDGTLTALKAELISVQEQIDLLQEESRVDDRAIHALESQISSQRAEYERERKKLDDASPVRALIEKSERVRKVIDELVPALFPLKIKVLAKAMTSVYKQLAHKNLVAKIEIKSDGQTRILSQSGKEITFDRSAGENQIFATALIAGLAEVSGVKAPLVVDTPLGRLDSLHRKNILRFWTGDTNRQVILLSQDEEIDPELLEQIADNVAKTYLLEHFDVGDGIGRTIAKENSYFLRAAQ